VARRGLIEMVCDHAHEASLAREMEVIARHNGVTRAIGALLHARRPIRAKCAARPMRIDRSEFGEDRVAGAVFLRWG